MGLRDVSPTVCSCPYCRYPVRSPRELLSEYDFSSVVLDLDREHLDYDEVCDLLGRAPLTTRFVALCGRLCEREASSLAAVGITTVRVSTNLDGLIEQLPR
ncbi:MAG: hypothetical protein U5O39_08780 [Gammaproteobacteria bacterium]|nr:hypothetical protein [Gammaproteobacteria bacterium]